MNKLNKNKNKNKMSMFNIMLIIIGVIGILGFVGVVIAQGGGGLDDGVLEERSLENDLANLSGVLVDSGYDWLVNYSVDYPSANIEVYLENGEEVIAVISNISWEGWYKTYLTELNETESHSTFDLKKEDKNE